MNVLNRRHFFRTSGMMAAGFPLLGFIQPDRGPRTLLKNLKQAVKFTRDGLDFHPVEYADLLLSLADEGKIPVDNYSRGGIVEQLEATFAQLLGKEGAVFMPTGTLANHIAVRKHAVKGRRIIVQEQSHLYNDSGDCTQTLSGLNLIPLNQGKTGFTLEDVQQAIDMTGQGRVKNRVGVISIESPVRRTDNAMFDFREMQRISAFARQHGIAMHLDGARLFNASGHTGLDPATYAALFDTVYISLYKDFNAASGAILAGSADFVEDLYHTRRMFGGGMPQVWPFAAVALHYADTFLPEYRKAIHAANILFSLLDRNPHFSIERIPEGTNVFLLHLSGIDPETFRSNMLEENIELPPPATGIQGFTMKINNTLLRRSPEETAEIFKRTLRKS